MCDVAVQGGVGQDDHGVDGTQPAAVGVAIPQVARSPQGSIAVQAGAGHGDRTAAGIEPAIAAGKDEKFRFFVRDSEGKLLAMSGPGGFATEKDAKDAIETLKEVIASAKVSTKKSDTKKSDK